MASFLKFFRACGEITEEEQAVGTFSAAFESVMD
jgi:hypothetical protein